MAGYRLRMGWFTVVVAGIAAAVLVTAWSRFSAPSAPEQAPPPPPAAQTAKAPWIPADKNRFGVPILDVGAVTGTFLSTSKDPAIAARSMSWGLSLGDELSGTLEAAQVLPVDLTYPVAAVFPNGVLFAPQAMEDKWVIAHRDGLILAARSWTGDVQAIGVGQRGGDTLRIREVRLATPCVLQGLGDPVEAFDWLIRTHALGELWPFPAAQDGLVMLETTPLAIFSSFGRRAPWVAHGWNPTTPSRPLRADGAVERAVRLNDADAVRRLVADGHPVQVPGTFAGYTPLHRAVVHKQLDVVQALLELGADPNALADGGATPLIVGVVQRAPREVLQALVDAGADPRAANADGFGALHALAEIDDPTQFAWLLDLGLDLGAKTNSGLMPVHIACGLGHTNALAALLDAGADANAESPMGTPIAIAREQGKAAAVALLEARGVR